MTASPALELESVDQQLDPMLTLVIALAVVVMWVMRTNTARGWFESHERSVQPTAHKPGLLGHRGPSRDFLTSRVREHYRAEDRPGRPACHHCPARRRLV